jgi:hypothetical protein
MLVAGWLLEPGWLFPHDVEASSMPVSAVL